MTARPPSRLTTLRQASRALLDERDESTLRRQSHSELSPLLWHIGHVFFVENYWIAEQVFGDTRITDRWRALYFPEECAKEARSSRLPDPKALYAWTLEVADHSDVYWRRAQHHHHALLIDGYLSAFVCQHYAQHLETMRLAVAQLDLEQRRAPVIKFGPRRSKSPRVSVPGHRVTLGTASIEAYDNEQPPVERQIEPFEIAARPVDNAQYLAFIEDDGYQRPELWDDDGWQWRHHQNIRHPQHWHADTDGWRIPSLHGAGAAQADEPVHGIGWYEARAFARYANARLPLEAEWEAADRADALSHKQQVWEWCDEAFAPYPGFKAFPYDGYSTPWFDGQHFMARGASVHTEPDVIRPGFRNFYPPTHRHVFAGLRLAG